MLNLGIVEVGPGFVVSPEGEMNGLGASGVELVGSLGSYDNVQLVGLGQMTEDTKKYLTWGGIFVGGGVIGYAISRLLG